MQQTFTERAKKELEDGKELYASLKEEVEAAANKIPELKSVLHPPEELQAGDAE